MHTSQQFEEPEPAQEYVSAEEFARALAAIESRQMEESADRLQIGEAIRQLGLEVAPEQILAEVKARRARERAAERAAARRRRSLRIGLAVALASLFVSLLILFLDARTATPPPAAASGPATGFGSGFDALMQTLRSNSFDEGRVAFVRAVVRGRTFTTEQARQILLEMSFDPARVQAAEILYPRLKDPQNAYRLTETMSFDQGRIDLIKRLGLDRP